MASPRNDGPDMIYAIRGLVVRKGEGEQAFRLEVSALDIPRGDCLAIAGPSGSGKSSLIDVLALLAQPATIQRFDFTPAPGRALALAGQLQGRDSSALAALRAQHIGFVPQIGGLLPALTVRQNVSLPCQLVGKVSKADTARVDALLERLGMLRHQHKKPAGLSVGERQRCAIARALAHQPAVVIADEPTAALDPYNADEVMGTFRDVAASLGSTLIVVSHDLGLVERFGMRRLEHHFRQDANGVVSVFGAHP